MRPLLLIAVLSLGGCSGGADLGASHRRPALSPGDRKGDELIEFLEANSQQAFDAGDFETASEGFALLEENGCPDFAAAQGKCLLLLDRESEAEPVLLRALEARPLPDTAFDLSIARFRMKAWDGAWKSCVLCLKWTGSQTRLNERAAELGMAIARRLEGEARREAWREIAKWAPETESGRLAAEELK